MSWTEYGFVAVSKNRTRVVLSLCKHPKTPSQISAEVGLATAHVSRALKEMAEKDIVVCLTPKVLKGRIYSLTDIGKSIAEVILKDKTSERTLPHTRPP
jgi:predicted transcriptional regulator